MKMFNLIWFHLKRILFNNWGYILISFLFPLVIIFSFLFIMDSDNNSITDQNMTIVNHSDYVEEHIVEQLSPNYKDAVVEDQATAFHQLDQLEAPLLYEIPAAFPEGEATIQVYSLSGENRDPVFEAEFMSLLTDTQTEAAFAEANISFNVVDVNQPVVMTADENINEDMAFVMFMLLFFMGYSAGFIAGDLAKLRKEGLLTRSIISNSYSWQILGSILAAYMVYLVLSSILIIGLTSLLFEIPIINIGLVLSLLVSMGVFVAGLTMVLFRIFKTEILTQMVGIIMAILLVFIPLFLEGSSTLAFIQYISPYYWVFEAMDTGLIFPHTLIILLYGLVLFTAGSFKVEKLVKV